MEVAARVRGTQPIILPPSLTLRNKAIWVARCEWLTPFRTQPFKLAMKRTLPSIPHVYRNIRRWTEIISVLSKYGLAKWLSRFNIEVFKDHLTDGSDTESGKQTTECRIRLALTELGPTFIKFGQLLSTRPDVAGPALALELEKLQAASSRSDSFEDIRETIESEQGRPLVELFATFEEDPIATASIGQVHRATLFDGRKVVVKVRRKGIDRIVANDLDILAGLAQLANRIDDFRNYQPVSIVADMSRVMTRELDLAREQKNLLQFRSMFRRDKRIEIPEPVTHLCSSKMLTMEEMDCISLNDVSKMKLDVDPAALAKKGANAFLRMIFEEGFYHSDPHPGNIVLTTDGNLGLLDFGQVSRVSESLREDFESMMVCIVTRDVSLLVSLIKRVGRCPHDLDESQLSNDVADFVGHYSTQELNTFDMSGALNDFMEIVRRFHITLPSEASMLIKVLVSLEGTGRLLNPDFSLMEVMRPFQRKMMLKRLSPKRQARKARRFMMQTERMVESLPIRISNILEQIQTGRFDVHLDHRRLGPSVNRLVVGLMVSAMFLGSSWMLSSQVSPIIFARGDGSGGVSLFGLTGMIVSLLMGLRLLWAIRKSGNLDQREN